MKSRLTTAEIKRKLRGNGKVIFTEHAYFRLIERGVKTFEVLMVLECGIHNPERDRYDEHKGWSYVIEGHTLDKKNLRIVVAFESSNTVVVTIVNLGIVK